MIPVISPWLLHQELVEGKISFPNALGLLAQNHFNETGMVERKQEVALRRLYCRAQENRLYWGNGHRR